MSGLYPATQGQDFLATLSWRVLLFETSRTEPPPASPHPPIFCMSSLHSNPFTNCGFELFGRSPLSQALAGMFDNHALSPGSRIGHSYRRVLRDLASAMLGCFSLGPSTLGERPLSHLLTFICGIHESESPNQCQFPAAPSLSLPQQLLLPEPQHAPPPPRISLAILMAVPAGLAYTCHRGCTHSQNLLPSEGGNRARLLQFEVA